MLRFRMVILALMLTVSILASADTVWNPSANGITPPDVGNWADAANWTDGVPGGAGETKAVFNMGEAAECVISDTQTLPDLVQGDNGPGGSIRIIDGGNLTTTGGWTAVSYNGADTTMIVEAGGVVNVGGHLWVGLITGGVGTVDINGGTVNVGQAFGLGTSGGAGYVNVNDGVLNLHHWGASDAINGASVMDIRQGSVTINGNEETNVENNVTAEKITAFGGDGEVVVDYNNINPGKTTITAVATETDPPTPNPASFESAPSAGNGTAITMTATIGSDTSDPVEYLFTEISGNPGGTSSGWQIDNSYTDTGLTASTTYTYSVTLRDSFGNEGTPSPEASATTWSVETTSIVWNPAGNGIYPPVTGDWADSSNWTTTTAGRPDGNFKCVFNISNTAEAVVSEVHVFDQLVQGDNGAADAGVIRVVDGGSLTTVGGWAGIGNNRRAQMIVETGGQVHFADHLWVGLNSPSVGTLDINGGIVSVGQAFGLGWDTGTGYVNVNDGVLSLHHWDYPRSINGASLMDIKYGLVTINGDQTTKVGNFVADGKITAFEGKGRVIFDYNATHSGKTTIQAIEGVDGDVNGDGGVDVKDLALCVNDWLDADCDSDANFDEWCLVDFHDFSTMASNWLGGIMTDWHIADTLYPTDDLIVTPHYAENFGIIADGTTDVTDAIQTALISVSNLGGGALFLPAGQYKITGTLNIPSRVTLRGDWQEPNPAGPVSGTILMAYAGRGDENGTPFIGLGNCAGIKGVTIWYPEQMPDDIQPYPPSIQLTSGGNQGVENVTFVNSYIGFTNYKEGAITASPFVRQIYGTPLKLGVEFDNLADVGRLETVHFSPEYWKNSGLPNSPTANQHAQWIYDNGIGTRFGRIDWSYSAYVTVEGYNVGLMLWPTRQPDSTSRPNGQSYAFTLRNCQTGVHVIETSYAGYQCTRFVMDQVETGIYLAPSSSADATTFHTCTINASNYAVLNEGQKRVLMAGCEIQDGPIRFDDGYLSVTNSDFDSPAGVHIALNSGTRGATIMGNRFDRSPQIVDSTSNDVYIDPTPIVMAPLPAYDYKKPVRAITAAKADLYVVTYSPYNAAADGVSDDTAAFQAALGAADANGGGIVFVPGGTYRLDGTLIVPTGVELRGVFDIPHGTSARGSLLNTYAGKNDANGTPFIQVETGAGLRGLTIHYPGQIYDETDTVDYGMTPYPFMIRALGADVYVINVSSTIPYQLLDLATHKCDRHYIDHMISTALLTGIHVGGGTENGEIHNCQFNPSAYTHQGGNYESIPYNTADGIHDILWRQSRPYLFGDTSEQVLGQNFVFGGLYGVHLIEENGNSPTGYCMGMGVDQCTNAMQIDSIGPEGLDMINSQIVTVNLENGRFLEVGSSFDDVFRMFSLAGWGGHSISAGINGGDVELQLFHLARDAETTAFDVRNDANLRNIGGNLTDYLSDTRPYVSIDASATAEFIGNIIRTPASNMPPNTSNVTSIGNVRVP